MRELKITMFGPRYVGKTSLLTAMYQQLENESRLIDIQLTPDSDTSVTLGDRLVELKSLSDDFEASTGIMTTAAPAGPDSLRSFVFDLGKKGEQPFLRLLFQDYPGGYVVSKDEEEQKFTKKLLDESIAVLIPIDAAALMEEGGKWHDYRNRSQDITNWFKKAYTDIQQPRLVILAPVKCESYLQTPERSKKLLESIQIEYANLLALFQAKALREKVAVVVTPVQTVGNVFFSHVEVINKQPHFHFSKQSHDAEYDPKNADQPLKYLLRFLLKIHIKEGWGWLNFVRNWFGLDEDIKKVVQKFAENCKSKEDEGFAIIQGKEWLNL